MSPGPELSRITREQALALGAGEELGARAQSLRDALGAARDREFTLVRGDPRLLMRTYTTRLAEAERRRVPVAGLKGLLDALLERIDEPVWGFTVRDSAMTYLAFTDEAVGELIAIVVVARSGTDSLLFSV